ncbi:Rsp5p-dependent ubiquitination, sorting of cargo proteins at the multivesicular body, partial [Irineochytrium annulatum]
MDDPLGLKTGVTVTDGTTVRLFPPVGTNARTVQSNLPLRPVPGMSFCYFEVAIVEVAPPTTPYYSNSSKPPPNVPTAAQPRTMLAIGLAARGYPIDRLPGCNVHSVAFSSDGFKHTHASHQLYLQHHPTMNGALNHPQPYPTHLFQQGGMPYGPTFGAGDVIGCGLNMLTNGCFFTVNGRYVGEAFYDLAHPQYHATVGSDGPCDLVVAFGEGPFAYGPANPPDAVTGGPGGYGGWLLYAGSGVGSMVGSGVTSG